MRPAPPAIALPTALLLLLGACTAEPAPTAAPASPTPAATPATTLSPPPTPTVAPTAAPTPAVEQTPAPTLEPTAAPTPSPQVPATAPPPEAYTFTEYDLPPGTGPHDVAPAPGGTVWYTGQRNGVLGLLDPATGEVTEVPLGRGSAPHGVIVGPDGAAWVTDGGRNEIQRVDPVSHEVTRYPLPGEGRVGLNTAAFDGAGVLWFTGQGGGVYGRVVPQTGSVEVFHAPRGRGPYGIAATPAGEVWFVSLAGSYLARIDSQTAAVTVFDPPTSDQGARRVWSDSLGRLWISEWNAGQVGMYDPAADEWREWPLPGPDSRPYSIWVDELDLVWLTDFGTNALVRFDPLMETFESFPLPSADAAVRQQLGREGEQWGAESANDKLVVLRRAAP